MKTKDFLFSGLFFIIALVIIWLIIIQWTGIPDKSGTVRILTEQGYTNIVTHGTRVFAGTDDIFRTEFEATSSNGSRVKGLVTHGWFKGSTIRFD